MGHKSVQVTVKIILFSCLAFSFSWLTAGQTAHADSSASVIVKVAGGVDVSEVAADYDAIVTQTLPSLYLYLFESSLPDFAAQLTADSRVIAIYEDTAIEGQPRFGSAYGSELDAKPWGTDSDPASAYK